MSVEELVIPSIEESICKASVNNYSIVEDRYYEHFYWCPGLKKSVLKNEDKPEDGFEEKEDSFMSKIKSKRMFIMTSRKPQACVKLHLKFPKFR